MKKLIFLAIISILWSCKSTDEPIVKPKVFKLDPNAMISIKPGNGVKLKVQALSIQTANDINHLTALEIVKQTTNMKFYNIPIFGNQAVGRGFGSWQRDTISATPSLKMFGTDIITQEGNIDSTFISATDCILQRIINLDKPNMVVDTVGYIPNSVLREAETKIKAAFEAKDNETVYKLFNEAFTFLPITGAEWRALKLQGKQ